MSKENYIKKLLRQVKDKRSTQKEMYRLKTNKNIGDDLSGENEKQKKLKYLEDRIGSQTKNVDRLSRPIERDIEPELSEIDSQPVRANTFDTFGGAGVNPPDEDDEERKKSVGRQVLENAQEEEETSERPDKPPVAQKKPENKPSQEEATEVNPARNNIGAQASQWTKQAGDYMKKLAKEAGKKVFAAIAKLPHFWLIVGAILLAGIIIAVSIAIITNLSNQQPNPTGASAIQAVDPLKDKDTIKKVLDMSGANIAAENNDNFLPQLSTELADLKAENPNLAEKIDAIQTIIGDIRGTTGKARENNATELVKKLKELVSNILAIPIMPAGMAQSPIKLEEIISTGATPHYGTAFDSRCIKGHRTFMQTCKKTCDATDLNAKATTTNVYSAFDGTVYKTVSMYGTVLYIKSDNNYYAVYAHMDEVPDKLKSKGAAVKKGEKLGVVHDPNGKFTPHLHFELAYKSDKGLICVTANDPSVSAANVQKVIWENMKTVMGIK